MPAPAEEIEKSPRLDQGRRTVLGGMASALFLSAAGAAVFGSKPAVAQSAAKREHIRALTITYPAGASIRFDAQYYREHHAKLFMDIYGSAIERFELRTISADLTTGKRSAHKVQPQAATFSALINVWIADFDVFHARSTAVAYQQMGDDKKNFTNTSSSIQVDEVRYETGESRSGIPRDCGCLSLLYPAGQAGGWNDDERCRAYVEGLKGLLGADALRRVELRQGIQQLDDGAPAYQGGVNIYVRNPLTFSQAWQRHKAAVEGLSTQLCSSKPVEVSTTVFGFEGTRADA